MTAANILLAVTAVLTGLVAGLFYAWSVSITRGLARVADREYVSVMQATNRAIQNPLFFASFFGAQILLPVSSFFFYGTGGARFWLILASTVVYTAGVMGVTVFGNVPLNNRLDRFKLESSSPEEIAGARGGYENLWNNLNTVRTVSSILALVLIVLACLKAKGEA
jgi:uncharacterized membrane protein